MLTIQPETAKHYAAIREVNLLAFGGEDEPRLIENLRRSNDFIPELSLVAIEDERVVGHVLFSPIIIETSQGAVPALALAPLAVQPDHQDRGIGSELVQHGLKECRRLGHRVVVACGSSVYYPPSGFPPPERRGWRHRSKSQTRTSRQSNLFQEHWMGSVEW